jgi:hypothetical protein
LSVSDVYASTCISPAFPTLPSGFADFTGAIQPYVITVPWTSSQFSISAEAAYVVFGFAAGSYQGTTYAVSPWTEPADIFTRGDSAGVQLIIADAIGLRGDKWLSTLGADAGAAQTISSNSNMITAIATAGASDPNATIGILGSATVDPAKNATGGLKPLAFQGIDPADGTDQECAYYPDSGLSTFDKINVRQGRYAIWGPEHFLTAVDGSGNPIPNANTASNPIASLAADVQKVINIITHNPAVVGDGGSANVSDASSTTPSLEQVIQAETAAYYIPTCAMQVSRSSEIGAEASYQPPQGCGCYYESQTPGNTAHMPFSTYCTACTSNSDCTPSYPTCNFGFCEVQ